MRSWEPIYMNHPPMSDKFVAYATGIIFLTIYACFAVLFYVAQTKLRTIEKHLNKCTWINDTYRLWGNSGIIGKIHRIGIIYSLYLFPAFWRRKKIIDFEQALLLPLSLKRWIQIPYTTMLVAAASLVLMYLCGAYQ